MSSVANVGTCAGGGGGGGFQCYQNYMVYGLLKFQIILHTPSEIHLSLFFFFFKLLNTISFQMPKSSPFLKNPAFKKKVVLILRIFAI